MREREAQLAQAEENLRRLKEQVAVGIERKYNKLERTRSMVEVANQVVKLRQEGERLARNQLTQGVVLVSERRQGTAATYKAQADSCRRDWDICSPGRNSSRQSDELQDSKKRRRQTELNPGSESTRRTP